MSGPISGRGELNRERRIAAETQAAMPIAASVKSITVMPAIEYAWPSMTVRYVIGILVAAVRKANVVAASGLFGPMAWNTIPIWIENAIAWNRYSPNTATANVKLVCGNM